MVRAVIENTRGEVLTVQRSSDHDWELPGGRLSRGEPPQEGLHREIREETGLRVEIAEIVKANSWINTAGDGGFAVHYYCETTDNGVTLSDEHVESKWVLPEQAEQLLCNSQIDAVHKVMTELKDGSKALDHSSLTPD
ncbi:NUDIX domain-containing protein [Halorubrum ezzemoulense]|uniref:NUDIX domain-containing protein n=1 Tax=Halorubrum ezzemoulense TaxID=337243 RepID=UPI00232E75D2|nr:NUDIX domain-containing protein [Halorubrum ezzemoulense]MDB9281741.1 NUDIX domain-containing protein [Halorubrum ezzemoulense]MDB9285271.1 NUDIX domain-containing protein [Halorubrum ezzemoulense]